MMDDRMGYSLEQAIAAADDPQYVADQYRAYVSSEVGAQIPWNPEDWFNRAASAEEADRAWPQLERDRIRRQEEKARMLAAIGGAT